MNMTTEDGVRAIDARVNRNAQHYKDRSAAIRRQHERQLAEVTRQHEEQLQLLGWHGGEQCVADLAQEVENLKGRRKGVEQTEWRYDPDWSPARIDDRAELEEVPQEYVSDEDADAELELIGQAVHWVGQQTNAEWLHMRTMVSTYINREAEKYNLVRRLRGYLILLDGNVKRLSELLGRALTAHFPLPAGKAWDPRIHVTDDDITVIFYQKNVPID
jgi:hypothetical protein